MSKVPTSFRTPRPRKVKVPSISKKPKSVTFYTGTPKTTRNPLLDFAPPAYDPNKVAFKKGMKSLPTMTFTSGSAKEPGSITFLCDRRVSFGPPAPVTAGKPVRLDSGVTAWQVPRQSDVAKAEALLPAPTEKDWQQVLRDHSTIHGHAIARGPVVSKLSIAAYEELQQLMKTGPDPVDPYSVGKATSQQGYVTADTTARPQCGYVTAAPTVSLGTKCAPEHIDAAEVSLQYTLRAVTGARQGQYGAAERNLKRIARLQKALQEVISDCGPEAQALLEDSGGKAALDLAMVKIARICQSPGHADSWADLSGYSSIGYRAVYEQLRATDQAAAARSIAPISPVKEAK